MGGMKSAPGSYNGYRHRMESFLLQCHIWIDCCMRGPGRAEPEGERRSGREFDPPHLHQMATECAIAICRGWTGFDRLDE